MDINSRYSELQGVADWLGIRRSAVAKVRHGCTLRGGIGVVRGIIGMLWGVVGIVMIDAKKAPKAIIVTKILRQHDFNAAP